MVCPGVVLHGVLSGISFLAAGWVCYHCSRLHPDVRQRIFPQQLMQLALSDLVFGVGGTMQDIIMSGAIPPGTQKMIMCYCMFTILHVGRMMSVLTEAHIASTLVSAGLHSKRGVRFFARILPSTWILGPLLGAMETLMVRLSTTTQCCSLAVRDWVGIVTLILAFTLTTAGYLKFVLVVIRRRNGSAQMKAIWRTAMYPLNFVATYGLLIFANLQAPFKTEGSLYAAAQLLQHCNGVFNAVTYVCALNYALVALPPNLLETSPASFTSTLAERVRGVFEESMLSYIAYMDTLEPHPSELGFFTNAELADSFLPMSAYIISNCGRLTYAPAILEHLLRFEGSLGRGAFGEVKLAEAITDWQGMQRGRQYAIKYVGMRDHALNERDAMLQVRHPGIIRLRSSFVVQKQEGPIWVLALEFCPGGTLWRKVKQEGTPGLELPLVRRYAAECLEALAYLHASHIIHRDLKTSNVLLSASDHCKIADFGLATMLSRARSLVGTRGYIAPEVWDRDLYTNLADIYSWGKLLQELITGSPFEPDEWPLFHIAEDAATVSTLVARSCTESPEERASLVELKGSPFFDGILWTELWPTEGNADS